MSEEPNTSVGDTTSSPSPTVHHILPVKLVSFLSAGIIALVGVTVVVFLFTVPNPTLPQYRIVISLLCFAITSVIGLMFASQVDFKTNLGVITASIVGPGALWFIGLYILTNIFPEPPIIGTSKTTVHQLGQIAQDIDRREGWIWYSEWKNQLSGNITLFQDAQEEYNLQDLLTRAYLTGNDKKKLTAPTVETVYITYADTKGLKHGIKLQRVSGPVDGGTTADIYQKAVSSLAGNQPQSCMFVLKGTAITEARPKSMTGRNLWVPITGSNVDCMEVALYPSGNSTQGDFFLVDVPKYTRSTANIYLGFNSKIEIMDDKDLGMRLWQLKPSYLIPDFADSAEQQEPQVPLEFRPVDTLVNRNDWTSDSDSKAYADLHVWLRRLDDFVGKSDFDVALAKAEKAANSGNNLDDSDSRDTATDASDIRDSKIFLQSVLADLYKCTGKQLRFNDLFSNQNGAPFPNLYSFAENGVAHPVIATFLWKQ